MPWMRATKPPCEVPAHYATPRIEDDVLHGYRNDTLIDLRRETTQAREALLQAQKACGRADRETARELSQWAKDKLKELRGIEAALGIIEGKGGYDTWRKERVQEEIAPYVDFAFFVLARNSMDKGES